MNRLGILLAFGCVMTVCTQAVAQPEPFQESVTLNTDNTVDRKIGSVRDFLTQQQWEQAIEFLEQIAIDHPQTLVEVSQGRYLNAQRYCRILLANLPEAGLRLYRQQKDARAKDWYERGKTQRDVDLVRKVVDEAYASSFGDEALFLLGEWAWERGELTRARHYWEQLLPAEKPADENATPSFRLRHPNPDVSSAEVRARLFLCSLAQGNHRRALWELDEIRKLHPDAESEIGGKNGKLTTLLEALSKDAQQWPAIEQPTPANTFALNAQRNGLTDSDVAVAAPVWSAPLFGNPFQGTSEFAPLKDQAPLCFHPVLWRDVVLVAEMDRISAWNIKTGRPAFPLDENDTNPVIYPLVEPKQPTLPFRPTAGVPRYTLTLHQNRLFARIGLPITGRSPAELRPTGSKLVSFDLADFDNSRKHWVVKMSDLFPDESGWAFEGTPVAKDGRLYVAVSRLRPEGQRSVVCLDAETGRLIWTSLVCATVSPIDDQFNVMTHHLLTLSDDLVFSSTDTGAVAALEQDSGVLRWVVTYRSEPQSELHTLTDHLKQGLLPAVSARGLVYVAPNDTKDVFAIEAETGLVRWRQLMPDRIRHLIGVQNGKLFLSGDSVWALDAETGKRLWGERRTDPEHFGYGRGVLAGDNLWWPTRNRVFILSQQTGKPIRQPIELQRKLGRGGNLLINDGRLIVAEPTRLVIYDEQPRAIKPGPDIITKNEPEIPPPTSPEYHQQAEKLFAAAKSIEDLQTVLQRYPESRIIGEARFRIARLYRKEQQVASAVTNYRLAAGELEKKSDQVAALWELAELCEKAALHQTAREIWQQLQADYPNETRETLAGPKPVSGLVTARLAKLPQHPPAVALPLQRGWSHKLPASSHALIPAGSLDANEWECMLINGPELVCRNLSDGKVRWRRTQRKPIEMAYYSEAQLILGSEGRLYALNVTTGKLNWDTTKWPQEALLSLNPEYLPVVLKNGPLLSTYAGVTQEGGIAVWNGLSGDLVFQKGLNVPADRIRLHDSRDWFLSARVIDPDSGEFKIILMNKRHPGGFDKVPLELLLLSPKSYFFRDDIACFVDAEKRLQSHTMWVTPDNEFIWTSKELVTNINVPPTFFRTKDAVIVLIDGEKLCVLEPKTGRTLWRQIVSTSPLKSPRESLCFTEQHVVVLSEGVLRGFRLSDGKLEWEQVVGATRQRWRVQKVHHALAVWETTDDAAAEVQPVVLSFYDPDTGQLQQRFRFPRQSESAKLRLFASDSQCLVLLGQEIFTLRSRETDD